MFTLSFLAPIAYWLWWPKLTHLITGKEQMTGRYFRTRLLWFSIYLQGFKLQLGTSSSVPPLTLPNLPPSPSSPFPSPVVRLKALVSPKLLNGRGLLSVICCACLPQSVVPACRMGLCGLTSLTSARAHFGKSRRGCGLERIGKLRSLRPFSLNRNKQ